MKICRVCNEINNDENIVLLDLFTEVIDLS